MMDIGRVCVKIAGRDSNKKCVIVSVLDDKFVLIDGETRRRKCNVLHLEPLNQVLNLEKDAAHAVVVSVFKKDLGIELVASKPKKKTVRPRILRRSKLAKAPSAKTVKAEKSAPKIVDAQVVKESKEDKPASAKKGA